jgi:hypothetical protein
MRYPSNRKPLREINGNLYEVVADYPIEIVVDPAGIKEWLGCDTAFKVNREGVYMFCIKIEDAIIIEEFPK